MNRLFAHPAELEKLAKQKYALPQFLMMENAAKAMADYILKSTFPSSASILIVCGKGNNGGDGYALARLLQGKLNVLVFSTNTPAAAEAKIQFEMCRKLGITIEAFSGEINAAKKDFKKICLDLSPEDFIVDCIYGTGFHGELDSETKDVINMMNQSRARKIACDIPSALEFKADCTITMGCQKLALYSDAAKAVCGKITVAELGIAKDSFENALAPEAFLIEKADMQLPFRKNRAAHKGKYGHTAVLCGNKAGAAILAATAAMNFGSGLTSLIEIPGQTAAEPTSRGGTPLSQFKISPSLMISKELPAKTTCVVLGPGFTGLPEKSAAALSEWFKSSNSPAAVLDAGVLTSPEFLPLLKEINRYSGARIILTPHLAEFATLLKNIAEEYKEEFEKSGLNASGSLTTALARNPELKIKAGKLMNRLFPNTTVIIKSAVTFIACGGQTYVIADGAQSLAKGGSGDILAGLTAALLAQGYTAEAAAITAAEHHALISQQAGDTAYNLTPEKLLAALLQQI